MLIKIETKSLQALHKLNPCVEQFEKTNLSTDIQI